MLPHDVPPSDTNERPQAPWHHVVTLILAILLLLLALWCVPDIIAHWQ